MAPLDLGTDGSIGYSSHAAGRPPARSWHRRTPTCQGTLRNPCVRPPERASRGRGGATTPLPAARGGGDGCVGRRRRVVAGAGLPPMPRRSGSGGYLLDVDPDRVDLLRFQRLVPAARQDGGTDESRVAALD